MARSNSIRSRRARERQVAASLPRAGGFTLVEILVVLVIIGVVTAAALLSFGLLAGGDALNRDARRLIALIELVSDEATLQGRDFGIEILRGGYRFVEYDPLINQWYEIVGDDVMRSRKLEDDTEFELFLEDKKIELYSEARDLEADDDEKARRDPKNEYLPHILILSSGDVSPFELRIMRRTDRAEITVVQTLGGELELKAGDDAVT